ncbi:uncharacterized protein LOC134447402 [Engraulis encrasicolus]|uniref:uncharacterized protein LOC134447402 n=1 Tax=Engraulis encrasicolus TaxID=184585 RepID=UPI002FD69123
MPRRDSMPLLYPRDRASPVTLDWIDGKNVKLLQVANHRESFRFKKLSQALSTIENIHKACWLREEKRIKQNLRRLASVSPRCTSHTIFKRGSNMSSKASMSRASGVTLPPCVSARGAAGAVGCTGEEGPPPTTPGRSQTQQSIALPSPKGPVLPSLPKAASAPCSLSRAPKQDTTQDTQVTQVICDREGEMTAPTTPQQQSAATPFSWASSLPSSSRMGTATPGTPKTSGMPSSLGLELLEPEVGGVVPSPSLLSLLPPHLTPELHGLQEAVLGFPLLQKRVRELMSRAKAMEQQRQERRSVALKPLEALRCRYLRLSESNITTLMDLCKESGIEVDIHPHMKDSDIDIATLFKDAPSPSPSTEIL